VLIWNEFLMYIRLCDICSFFVKEMQNAALVRLQLADCFSNFAPDLERVRPTNMTQKKTYIVRFSNKIHDFHAWGVAALI